MAKITYVEPGGNRREVDVDAGDSVMQVAIKNNVVGIVAECGGNRICGTCHVHVDEKWYSKLPLPEQGEREMLEGVVDPVPTSRLSCQLQLSEKLDGLIVYVAESQF